MTFYRLTSLTTRTPTQAFSGEGGLHFAGRWNSRGTRLVYASTSAALACLETLVHIRKLHHTHERWLFAIDVPDQLVQELGELPPDWDAEPSTAGSQTAGDNWIAAQSSVALLVPSVVVRMEKNALINPRHPQFKLAWVAKPVRFRYDPRLKGYV